MSVNKMGLRTFTGYLRGTERVGSSVNGNPSYTMIMEGINGTFATFRTMSDAGFAYGITNPEYQNALMELALTGAGRVRSFRVLDKTPDVA